METLHISGLDELAETHARATRSIVRDIALGMSASAEDMGRALHMAARGIDEWDDALSSSVDDFSTDPGRWYCRYCRHLNHPDALYCGEIVDGRGAAHCGAPRPEEDGREGLLATVTFDEPPQLIFDLLEEDTFWLAVQAVTRVGGFEIDYVAHELKRAIVTRSPLVFDNLGLHNIQVKGTYRQILDNVEQEAMCLDTFDWRLHSFVIAYRERQRFPTPYAGAVRSVGLDRWRDAVIRIFGR